MSQSKSIIILFLIPTLIWGSSWYIIKHQLGMVPVELSVAYRFLIAGGSLLFFLLITRKLKKMTTKQHGQTALQALFLFGLNYFLIYHSEKYLTSALVSMLFSLIIFFNMINARIIMRSAIKKNVLIGGTFGILGTVLLFQPSWGEMTFGSDTFIGVVICVGGVFSASLGNVISANNQKLQLPLLTSIAFGMFYGGSMMFIFGLIKNQALIIDDSFIYVSSLFYLVVFGSLIAFIAYLKLIGEVGPAKASYALLSTPIIAIIISIIFEDYELKPIPILGIGCILLGNFLAMKSK